MADRHVVMLVQPSTPLPGSLEAAVELALARGATALELWVIEDAWLRRLSERRRPVYGRELVRWSGRGRTLSPVRLRAQRQLLMARIEGALRQAAARRSLTWSLSVRQGDVSALLHTVGRTTELVLLDRRLSPGKPLRARLDASGTLRVLEVATSRDGDDTGP